MSVAEAMALVLLAIGCAFFGAGTLGLLRFPDVFSRLHALTKADNLGLGLVALGLLPWADGILALKIVCVWVLVQFSSSTVSQLIARLAQQERPPA